jgi:hypothetical protein
MALKNPRLTLTLTPSLAAQLRRLSELTGNSQAALISELLEGNEAVFARLIKLLEAAQAAKGDMVAQFSADMDQAQEKIERQLGLALEAIDVPGEGLLLKDAERIKRRSAKRTAAEGTRLRGGSEPGSAAPRREVPTPISNRGVRSTTKTAEKPTTMRVSRGSGRDSV